MSVSEGKGRVGYRAITQLLQDQIEAGSYVPGSFLPTERELQDEFGVSRTTVRRALSALVELGWAESLPGRGVVAARGYRRSAAGRVAVIDNDSPVARMLHKRMRDGFRTLGLDPVFMGESAGFSMEDALCRARAGDFAAALVWSYEGFLDPELLIAVNRQIPIIALDHSLGGVECDLIGFDYEQAAFDATLHLIRQGCRRIGVVGMLDMLDITHARFRGYLRAMFAHNLQPEPKDFTFVATSGHNHADTLLLETRLRSGDRPDGIFVMQDSYGADTVSTALRAGLSLPHDLKLATIGDDFDIRVDDLGLTAVALDWQGFIDLTFERLRDRLENLHAPPVARRAEHRLIVRGLCGAPADQVTRTTGLLAEGIEKPKRHFISRWRLEE